MDLLKKLWYSKDTKAINSFKYLMMLDLNEEELNELIQVCGGDEILEKYKEKIVTLNQNEKYVFRPKNDEELLKTLT